MLGTVCMMRSDLGHRVHEYSRRQHVEHIVEPSRPNRRQQRVAVPQQVEIPDPRVIGAAPLWTGGLLQRRWVPVRLVKRKTCAQEMMSQHDDESAQRVLFAWLGLTWQGFVGAELDNYPVSLGRKKKKLSKQ